VSEGASFLASDTWGCHFTFVVWSLELRKLTSVSFISETSRLWIKQALVMPLAGDDKPHKHIARFASDVPRPPRRRDAELGPVARMGYRSFGKLAHRFGHVPGNPDRVVVIPAPLSQGTPPLL
jgi:hypothetical protein